MAELKTYSILNDVSQGSIHAEKLYEEITASLFVNGFSGIITTEESIIILGELISNEIGLDNLIFSHEPICLNEAKRNKYNEIDLRTNQLIEVGFIFDGNLFSMSVHAQINWSNFPQIPESLFPINITTKDDNVYSLLFSNKMNFYFTALGFKNQYLQSGGVLKSQVKACLTIQEISTIIDNR